MPGRKGGVNVDNNPKWVNDLKRTGDQLVRDSEARGVEREMNQKRLKDLLGGGDGSGGAQVSGTSLGEIIEGAQTLVAFAFGVVGLFVGGTIFGWIGAIALGAVGFIGTIFVFGFLEDKMRDMAENRLWKRWPQDRTRDDLKEFWESKFGSPISEQVLKEIDLDGAAWVMDKKANFILRLKSGERLYVGFPDGVALRVEKRGGKGLDARDAWLMMLARKSAGAKATKPAGDEKMKAYLWAAAQIIGLEVVDYKPDAFALEVHQKMKQEYEGKRL